MSATATNATMSTEPIKIDYRLSMIAKCRIAFVLLERSCVNLSVPVLRLHSRRIRSHGFCICGTTYAMVIPISFCRKISRLFRL
jgi:hypothetical protein